MTTNMSSPVAIMINGHFNYTLPFFLFLFAFTIVNKLRIFINVFFG